MVSAMEEIVGRRKALARGCLLFASWGREGLSGELGGHLSRPQRMRRNRANRYGVVEAEDCECKALGRI